MKPKPDNKYKEFFHNQLNSWSLADKNFKDLAHIERKSFKIGDLDGSVQYNPFRAGSTLAKTDKDSVRLRKCFLCSANRPAEQDSLEILDGWELLVNPFPILPYHFTISSKKHEPQILPLETALKLAQELEGMSVFFNGNGAGASAPDHCHFQAVPIDSLPLVSLIREAGKEKISDLNLPFDILTDLGDIKDCNAPLNAFFWTETDNKIHFFAIPRKAHRPRKYYLEAPDRRAVSPGAIDMAGIIVTPYKEDFDLLNSQDIEEIYQDVGFCNGK